ncbi:MAG: hypothetical protein ACD_11C00024G0014 [uncultured bacterium]|nr:MAG: hypothetical protein ACD_11C00024G0014 [uncultured bacterium]HBR72041.1 hypothetical protein [Candidatus Moranbacteria bacterium]
MSTTLQIFNDIFVSFKMFGSVFADTWYWIFPMPFYFLFKTIWMNYIIDGYFGTINTVMLEIIVPKNVEKSPKVMEALYIGMQGAEKTYNVLEQFTDGAVPARFSMEIVGSGGDVHFYIRTPKNFRDLVEAHLYAQYPDAVVVEVPDYVDSVPKLIPNEKWDLWGTDFEFLKNDAYPIRTYRYFEEDITGKMIDPLSGLIEVMSKLPPGQNIWLQIGAYPLSPSWSDKEGKKLAEKLKGKEKKEEGLFEGMINDFKEVFSNLGKAPFGPVEFEKKEKKEEQPLEFRLSPGEKEVLKVVEENLGKMQFKVKIRFILVGRKENFDKSMVSAFVGGLKQFNDNNFNSLKPDNTSKTYSFLMLKSPRLKYRQRKILRRYRDRSFDGAQVVLNTEELATLFHIPDMSVVAPSVSRVEAKRGGAPFNLPVE